MKKSSPVSAFRHEWVVVALVFTAVLALLFWRSFLLDYVHFSNDGPLGQIKPDWIQPLQGLTGTWDDMNTLGTSGGSRTFNITSLFQWLLGPVAYSKFYAPIAILILGVCAWTFFRALGFGLLARWAGALATMLSSCFFSAACWGVAPQEIGIGATFLALAMVASNTPQTTAPVRWARLALAGFCVGLNVTEAADIGALLSVFVAGFTLLKSLLDAEGSAIKNAARGVAQVAVIAVFAGFLSIQTVTGLVSTQIKGIAGTAQDAEAKQQHWDWATQWSLPKLETLGLVVPGLFGYKMDTPKGMMPQFQKSFEGGVYWGGMGRSPEIDRFLDSGAQGQMPQGFMRFSGGGGYCGILVCLLAAWAVAQSLRKKDSPFSDRQKKFVWFWTVVLIGSLLLAWGRFAPMFYGALYQLPYFSTIRNPAKFLIFFSLSVTVLFAYGLNALANRLNPALPATSWANWWARAAQADRRWILGCGAALAASTVGWLLYSSQSTNLVHYLQKMGFPDENFARQIADFSVAQAGWFALLLTVACVLVAGIMAGCFGGERGRWGALLVGGFLFFDLGRANLPYVIHWDYKQKYEIGTLNPVVDFLRNKPYEHRVAGLPFRAPEGLELFDQVYRIEWMQHHFPYYDIQCLDIIQMPRMPVDLKTFLEALAPRGTAESVPLIAREWALTNTRYLLGAAGYLDVLNQQLDPIQHRFRTIHRFEIAPKPGILQPTQLEELTAVPNENGRYALFEFTGALPRVKLYANWQVNTNDMATVNTLADLSFDPAKTVLVSTPQPGLPAVATNENSGTVEFKSYSPKHIVFTANASAPSVLLLNDRYDANWHVTVDDKPADLLRCNYIMRGVYLSAGPHTVKFDFSMANKPIYVTFAAIGASLCLAVWLGFATKRKSAPQITSADSRKAFDAESRPGRD